MLRFFYKNKLKYSEGQLAPFFIAVLAILIILALITINLGKVAFIRTETTNAADSGAISAGSMMANVFNGLASANAEMEKWYWTFIASVSVSYVIAFLKLSAAVAKAGAADAAYGVAEAAYARAGGLLTAACSCQACCGPHNPGCCACWEANCAAGEEAISEGLTANTAGITANGAAIAAIGWFIMTTWAILVATTAYYIAQWYYYRIVRRNTREGRESAVGGGHSYAFTNSGLASKLKEGAPPDDVTDPKQQRNYRDEFDEFLDGIGHDQHYAYDWEDGQERAHSVETDVAIEDVEDYDLKVSVLPFAADIVLLAVGLSLGYSAKAALASALAEATEAGATATAALPQACPSPCTAAGTMSSVVASMGLAMLTITTTAIPTMTSIYIPMAIAWAGLAPGPVVGSHSDSDAWPWIICWIVDIIHDRLVRVEVDQHHEGADLGLWETRYPDVHSYSLVSFKGTGSIHKPKLEHDASIIETD